MVKVPTPFRLGILIVENRLKVCYGGVLIIQHIWLEVIKMMVETLFYKEALHLLCVKVVMGLGGLNRIIK